MNVTFPTLFVLFCVIANTASLICYEGRFTEGVKSANKCQACYKDYSYGEHDAAYYKCIKNDAVRRKLCIKDAGGLNNCKVHDDTYFHGEACCCTTDLCNDSQLSATTTTTATTTTNNSQHARISAVAFAIGVTLLFTV